MIVLVCNSYDVRCIPSSRKTGKQYSTGSEIRTGRGLQTIETEPGVFCVRNTHYVIGVGVAPERKERIPAPPRSPSPPSPARGSRSSRRGSRSGRGRPTESHPRRCCVNPCRRTGLKACPSKPTRARSQREAQKIARMRRFDADADGIRIRIRVGWGNGHAQAISSRHARKTGATGDTRLP